MATSYFVTAWKLVNTLAKAGVYGARVIVQNPQSAKVALTVAGPDIARYFIYSQLENLFPGSSKFLPMLENVGQAAMTVGPLVLIAPETMPIVASYVLLVALKEGGILLIRFASAKTYQGIKSWISRAKVPQEMEMEDFSKEKIGEGWVIMKDDTKPLMDDFVFLQPGDSAATEILNEIRSISDEAEKVSASPPKVTINHDALKKPEKGSSHSSHHHKPKKNRGDKKKSIHIRQSSESSDSEKSNEKSPAAAVCLTANIVTDDYPK